MTHREKGTTKLWGAYGGYITEVRSFDMDLWRFMTFYGVYIILYLYLKKLRMLNLPTQSL